MPITEHLWGPFGGKLLGKIPGLKNKIGDDVVKTWSPIKRYLSGIVGEALEELPGNITEELEKLKIEMITLSINMQ